ncbi:conjugative transposon protein TraM [Sphingobacterium puteale]|uniref:conjugative transposon protein TraM n=1 Tax=Sphingobacterium puteale TaxID=2420510 RepID=UPI003D996250
MKNMTQKQLRFRKLLLVLPLITLPFTTLGFWALGGGRSQPEPEQKLTGINTDLPDAQLKNKNEDKLSLYQSNGGDTAINESLKPDTTVASSGVFSWNGDWNNAGASGSNLMDQDMQQQRLQQRLDDLERLMRQPAPPDYGSSGFYRNEPEKDFQSSAGLQRIEQMVNNATGDSQQPDAELDQLNGMLERVLDIQHPERYRQRLKDYTHEKRGRILPVGKETEILSVPVSGNAYSAATALNLTKVRQTGAFFGLDANTARDSIDIRSITAIVAETQTVVSGSSLKMQLAEEIYIAGFQIPKGTPIYGSCMLEGERLMVAITGIRLGNRHFPVELKVYGLDAMPGIRIPGAITRDAAKDGADRAVQSMQLMSLDPSIGAQAAGAGIEAAKSLFSKKVKLIKATVNAGLQILLVGGDTN